MLVKSSIEDFSRILGSSSPAPGGGSVAALSGSLGADLVSMVCGLSIGKEDYEPFHNELAEVLADAQTLSKGLLERIDLDAKAFNGVMAAFKMAKETEEEKMF
jgi:formiminotetrahydrofolate cyclodeaminase